MKKLFIHQLAGLALCGLLAHPAQAQTPAKMPEMTHKGAYISSAAFAPDGSLWLLQYDGRGQLHLKISNDDGQTWQAPRPLNTGSDKINIAGESNPKIVFGPNGVVLISYAQPLAKRFTGEIRLLRSTDHGKTFAAPVTVHQDRQVISHSFSTMAFDAQGQLHTIWIDSRDKAKSLAENLDAASNSPARPLYRGVALYHNISSDGGASFGPDLKLAEHSCECCRLALSPTTNGSLALMWRQVFAPNIRDHAFITLDAAQNQQDNPVMPNRATEDGWAIDACPHHGPSLTNAGQGNYHAVWFGSRSGEAQVRYGKLNASGKPIGTVRALPDNRAEHADILSSDAKVVIVWRSFDGKGMHAYSWVSEDDGQHFKLQELGYSEAENDYPRLIRKPGAKPQLFMIWNTAEKTHVKTF